MPCDHHVHLDVHIAVLCDHHVHLAIEVIVLDHHVHLAIEEIVACSGPSPNFSSTTFCNFPRSRSRDRLRALPIPKFLLLERIRFLQAKQILEGHVLESANATG